MKRKRSSRIHSQAKAPPELPEIVSLFRTWFKRAIASGGGHILEKQDQTEVALGAGLSRLMLDEKPEALVKEWSTPVINAIGFLTDVLLLLETSTRKNRHLQPIARSKCEMLLERLDFALALIYRHISSVARFRGHRTQSIDLLFDVLAMVNGDGVEASALIERIQKSHPEVDRLDDGRLSSENTVDNFAWETYQRVEALDRLIEQYPEHARWAARQMHAWPMLRSLHHTNDVRFRELAKRLQVGRDYPLEASEAARFRADTPMVRLLDPLLVRLCHLRQVALERKGKFKISVQVLRGNWWDYVDDKSNEEEIPALRQLHKLPPLTTGSAKRWATAVVVPAILATYDVRREGCTEPVLRSIWNHRGVKSAATFRSRLEAAVISYLRRMARKV